MKKLFFPAGLIMLVIVLGYYLIVDNSPAMSASLYNADGQQHGINNISNISYNIPGRITDPAVHSSDPDIVFAAEFSGIQDNVVKIRPRMNDLPQDRNLVCGDVDGNDSLQVGDALTILNHILHGYPLTVGLDVADVDGCGSVNVADASYLLEYIFSMGPAPCQGSVTCALPTGGNLIELGCPVEVPEPAHDTANIPVYITNDTPLESMTIGFHYNSDDIEVIDVDSAGTFLPKSLTFRYDIDPIENRLLILWVKMNDELPVQEGGLLGTIRVLVPAGTPLQVVDFDTVFYPPAGDFMFTPVGGGSITPAYADCDTSDMHIGFACGDANGDGFVNVGDAVYMINHVFKDGPPPDPLIAGEVNCDGTVNVGDAVYLINYVFKNGPAPCECE